ncbi:glycosyltransferase family 1 protein [Moniliophthora roreri]|uniref:Glycosyltransferase family 1 protein n=1 Tax=Moniliophthora roreri TaxID=221103 RepID=A0A0W0FYP0_MONRR|nr:glycosyltransferase family 1 protein [Moniliophthora roreri]
MTLKGLSDARSSASKSPVLPQMDVSFGSVTWPAETDKLFAVLETLVKNDTPFILAHPDVPELPTDIRSLIDGSEIAMALSWAPQQEILAHKVTGWFMTHGGWNSTQEGIMARVPMIFWPYSADQPVNAGILVLNHKAALELIEVRTTEWGQRKPYRELEVPPTYTTKAVRAEVGRLLERLKGPGGQVVRENALALGDKVNKLWEQDGESRKELLDFLSTFCS